MTGTPKGGRRPEVRNISRERSRAAAGRFGSQAEVERFPEDQPAFLKCLSNDKSPAQRITDILSRPTYAGYIEVPEWSIPLRKGQCEGLVSLSVWKKGAGAHECLPQGGAPAKILPKTSRFPD